jgi:hypothetical protein
MHVSLKVSILLEMNYNDKILVRAREYWNRTNFLITTFLRLNPLLRFIASEVLFEP